MLNSNWQPMWQLMANVANRKPWDLTNFLSWQELLKLNHYSAKGRISLHSLHNYYFSYSPTVPVGFSWGSVPLGLSGLAWDHSNRAKTHRWRPRWYQTASKGRPSQFIGEFCADETRGKGRYVDIRQGKSGTAAAAENGTNWLRVAGNACGHYRGGETVGWTRVGKNRSLLRSRILILSWKSLWLGSCLKKLWCRYLFCCL